MTWRTSFTVFVVVVGPLQPTHFCLLSLAALHISLFARIPRNDKANMKRLLVLLTSPVASISTMQSSIERSFELFLRVNDCSSVDRSAIRSTAVEIARAPYFFALLQTWCGLTSIVTTLARSCFRCIWVADVWFVTKRTTFKRKWQTISDLVTITIITHAKLTPWQLGQGKGVLARIKYVPNQTTVPIVNFFHVFIFKPPILGVLLHTKKGEKCCSCSYHKQV